MKEVLRGADVGSDHILVVDRLRFEVLVEMDAQEEETGVEDIWQTVQSINV